MKNISLKFLFLLALHLLSFSLFAQKHFHLIIKLPQGINKEKVEVWLEDGKENKQIKAQTSTTGQLVLTGDYYSLYAVVSLQYPQDPPIKGFVNSFFIQEKPAVITFHPSGLRNAPFNNYSLQNVLDFKEEKKQLNKYDSVERKKAMDYEVQHGDKIFIGSDTAIRNYYFQVLAPAVQRKRLEYIIRHPGSYYSFYCFKDVAKPGIASWDSLLVVFNAFPDKFKYSDEGNYFNEYLHGRLLFEKKGDAIDFTARDINKKKVTLSDFEGKKYVLLHFWATWCTPCMRELPAIKEISNEYKSKDVQVISIAIKSNSADYLETINKYQMDWIHIYNDPALLNKYGNVPVPRVCLIDKTGKLVYNKFGLGENDDFQLNELKEKLKEVIHN